MGGFVICACCIPTTTTTNDRRFGDHREGKQRRFEEDLSLKQVSGKSPLLPFQYTLNSVVILNEVKDPFKSCRTFLTFKSPLLPL
jgi:hypothetical protein